MNAFNDPAKKTVLTPALLLNNLAGANYASVKANGGDFSAGLAFTSNNGVIVEDASFAYITVKPGGSWSYTATVPAGGGTTPPAGGTSGDISLQATTVAPQDGALSLSVPAGAKATFGQAQLVNNKSTSTASLPEVTVTDDRVVSKKGWTLTQTVRRVHQRRRLVQLRQPRCGPQGHPTGTTSTGVVPAAAQTAARPSTPPCSPARRRVRGSA